MKENIFLRSLYVYIKTFLGGYIRPMRYEQIFNSIHFIKPKKIMEVGVWKGSRGKMMIQIASKYSPVNSIEYFGFDLFETMSKDVYTKEISKMPPKESDVHSYLEDSGAQIHLFAGYTQDTMKDIDQLPKMDFVFIDGGHATETVLSDWQGVQKVMDRDTVVIFDDYWHNRSDGPKVVIDAIDKGVFDVEFLPEVDVFFNKDFGRLVISLVKVARK